MSTFFSAKYFAPISDYQISARPQFPNFFCGPSLVWLIVLYQVLRFVFPGTLCLCLSLCFCLSVSVSLCLSLCVCLLVCLCVWLSFYVCLCVTVNIRVCKVIKPGLKKPVIYFRFSFLKKKRFFFLFFFFKFLGCFFFCKTCLVVTASLVFPNSAHSLRWVTWPTVSSRGCRWRSLPTWSTFSTPGRPRINSLPRRSSGSSSPGSLILLSTKSLRPESSPNLSSF